MKHGFVKVAAATPDIRVADVEYNTEQICRLIDETACETEAKSSRVSGAVYDRIYVRRFIYTGSVCWKMQRKDCRRLRHIPVDKDGISRLSECR